MRLPRRESLMSENPLASDNPFQSPRTDARAVGVRGGSREELLKVAKAQKGVIYCLLAQILLAVAAILAENQLPPLLQVFLGLAMIVAVLAGVVYVFLLCANVYPSWVGPVLGLLALVPCISLLVLLGVNGKATSILRQNGIRVGFMGAGLKQLEQP
jgi:hypothetical protein